MKLLLVLILAIPAFSQDITDILAIANAIENGVTPVVTLTGTDGTVCALGKVGGPKISLIWKCNSSDGKDLTKTSPILTTSSAVGYRYLGQGQVICLLTLNPTAAASGGTPASGMSYSCTPGDGTIKTGVTTWP